MFTAPASGTVVAIHRGERRVLQSVVIQIEGDEKREFARFDAADPPPSATTWCRRNCWSRDCGRRFARGPIAKRPCGHCAGRYLRYGHRHQPAQRRSAASYPAERKAFDAGLTVLTRLTPGKVHVCRASGGKLGGHPQGQVAFNEFAGPHPAGLVGTHIHFTEPVSLTKQVWHLNYQDVIAIGKLFTTGELCAERIIAIGGPQATQPRLVRTLLGADLTALLAGETKEGENRIISGSVLSGRHATGPMAGWVVSIFR